MNSESARPFAPAAALLQNRGDNDAIVVSQVRTSDNSQPQEMSWRVVANGSWHIVDIQAQDIWFAIEQRAQFQAIGCGGLHERAARTIPQGRLRRLTRTK